MKLIVYNGSKIKYCELRVTGISSPWFSQSLHYMDNPYAPASAVIYNGISYTYRREGDDYAFYDRDGNSYMGDDPFMTSLTSALKEIGKGRNGSALLDYLANHENTVEIKESKRGNGALLSKPYEILFDPKSINGGYCEIYIPFKEYTTERPPFIGLAHEMAHIQDKWKGTLDESVWYRIGNDITRSYEKKAIHIENLIRNEHNLPLRTHYQSISNIPLEQSRVVLWNIDLYNNYIYYSSPFKSK